MPGGFGPYLNGTMSRDAVPRLTDMAGREQFVASDDGFDVSLWDQPLGAEALAILIHEAAHARNMHHGKSFHDEVERLGGVAAEVMLRQGAEVRRNWPDFAGETLQSSGSVDRRASGLSRWFAGLA